jgi:hypothetical protein
MGRSLTKDPSVLAFGRCFDPCLVFELLAKYLLLGSSPRPATIRKEVFGVPSVNSNAG